jgi:hypothetical protein
MPTFQSIISPAEALKAILDDLQKYNLVVALDEGIGFEVTELGWEYLDHIGWRHQQGWYPRGAESGL